MQTIPYFNLPFYNPLHVEITFHFGGIFVLWIPYMRPRLIRIFVPNSLRARTFLHCIQSGKRRLLSISRPF